MYCSKCGKEIQTGAKFCTGCGTQVATIKVEPATGESFSEKIRGNASVLKKCMAMFVITILGLIVSVFFLNAEMIKATFDVFSRTHTETFTMFRDKDFFKVLFILAYLTAAILMAVPLLTGKEWQSWNMWLSFIVPAIAIIVLVLVAVSAKGNVSEDELSQYVMEAMDVKVKLAASGWIFIIINLATVALGYKTCIKIEEEQSLRESIEEEEKTEEKTVPYWCAMCEMEGPFANEGACPRCGSRAKKFFKL